MSNVIANPNSPDNLLSPWLESLDSYQANHDLVGSDNEYIFSKGVLAHILDFADQNNKLIQMYNWLISSEGNAYLLKSSRTSEFVCDHLRSLSFEVSFGRIVSPEYFDETAIELREWIQDNTCLLPSYLALN